MNEHNAQEHTDRGITDSTELGYLPTQISTGLLLITLGCILFISGLIGVVRSITIVVFITGIIAASGVRGTVSTTRKRFTLLSSLLLWVSGITFTIVTGLLVINSNAPVHVTVIVACGSVLAGFGIVGNTIQSFGSGISKRVVLDYVIGVGVLIIIGVFIGVVKLLVNTVLSGGVSVLDSLLENPINGIGVFIRGGGSIFVYGLFLAVLRKIIDSLPMEILVSGNNYGDIKRVRKLKDKIYETGLFVIGVYLLVVVGGFIADTQMNHPIGDVLRGVTDILSSPPLMTGIISILVLLTGIVGILSGTKRATKITTGRVLSILIPPFTVVFASIIVEIGFGNAVRNTITGTMIEEVIRSSEFLTVLVESYLSIVLIGMLLPLLVISVVIFSIPSFISGVNAVKSPISGVITACIGITMVLLAGVYGGIGVSVVLFGVLTTIVVWGVGEHSVVAVGELKPTKLRGRLSELTGLNRVTIVHAVVVCSVGIIGFITASGFITVSDMPRLPQTTALVIVVVASVGLIVLDTKID